MNAFFADTFYWIAFTNVQDLAHERVKGFTRSARPDVICTTEEVLTEYLNYFAAWGPHFRQKAALNIQDMLANRMVRVVAQTTDSFRTGGDGGQSPIFLFFLRHIDALDGVYCCLVARHSVPLPRRFSSHLRGWCWQEDREWRFCSLGRGGNKDGAVPRGPRRCQADFNPSRK